LCILSYFIDDVFQDVTSHVTEVVTMVHRKIARLAKTDGKNQKSMDVQTKTNVPQGMFVNQTNTA
jgi:hypothetical protein